MRTLHSFLLAASATCALAHSGSAQEPSIDECFPDVVPVRSLEPPPAPAGWTAGWTAAPPGAAHRDLGAPSPEDVAAADEAAALRSFDVVPAPTRVGLVRELAGPLELSRAAAWELPLDGERKAWVVALRSPGAVATRLHVSGFDARGGEVLVYAELAGEPVVRGPFRERGPRGSGEFWTASLPGEVVYLEGRGSVPPRLTVDRIVHFDRHPGGGSAAEDDGGVSAAEACNLDVMCYSSAGIDAVRNAVGQMNYVEGGLAYVCTGTVLNDQDPETWVPYFLSAWHCLHTEASADSLEVVWFWQRESCGGSLPTYFFLPRNVGADFLTGNPTDGGNDMSFFRLDDPLPSGVGMAGWTTADLAGSGLFGIHHPGGDYKRFATFVDDFELYCIGFDAADYHFTRATSGTTEGGSSGSAIFNASGQVQGQLYGKCFSSAPAQDCGTQSDWRNVWGEFATTYDFVVQYLAVGGTLWVDASYTGSIEFGTWYWPYDTLGEAHAFAWDGARLRIVTGTYPETLTLSKAVEIDVDGGAVTIGF